MAELSKGFLLAGASIQGGLTESERYLTPLRQAALAEELTCGPSRILDDIDIVPFGAAMAGEDKYQKELPNRLVIGHSLAAMAVDRAGLLAIFNGVEPTPYHRAAWGMLKLMRNDKIGREPQVPSNGSVDPIIEFCRHFRANGRALRDMRRFSTVQHMINGGEEAFPAGRIYLPASHDEYGFGGNDEVNLARKHGIVATMLFGYHNQPLEHPMNAVTQLRDILETM